MLSNPDEVTLYLSREMLAMNSVDGSLSDRFMDDEDDEEDEDDQLFSLRPVNDEWRQLFDKYDPEGFGEIPIEDFEKALDSRDFLQAISPGKLIILQDKAVQLRQMKISAITFQDFVNTLSGKRTLSFKCAMHCRDKQVVDNQWGEAWEPTAAATPEDGFLSRSSSIYTIVDKFMSTVANETLTDDRDRKYFLDSHREPGNGYKCCTWPLLPTLFIPVVSIVQIAVQIVFSSHISDHILMDNPLVFHPHRLEEPWRYASYFLIHLDWLHLAVNVTMQLVLGIPLEMVHGFFRLVLIYMSGVFSGSVAASVFDSSVVLAGCGGGVFSLLSAHLANLVLHYETISRPYLKLIGLLGVASIEVGFAIYRRYAPTAEDYLKVGYVAQLAGIVSGLTIGLVVLKNYEQKLGERTTWWIAIVVLLILSFAVFLYHGLRENDAFRLLCNPPDCQ